MTYSVWMGGGGLSWKIKVITSLDTVTNPCFSITGGLDTKLM